VSWVRGVAVRRAAGRARKSRLALVREWAGLVPAAEAVLFAALPVAFAPAPAPPGMAGKGAEPEGPALTT